jgi:hypothetical protein
MSAVLPGDSLLPHQAYVRLVYESGRLKRVIPALTSEVRGCPAAELAIHDRHQVLARLDVSPSPRAEQMADAAGLWRHI